MADILDITTRLSARAYKEKIFGPLDREEDMLSAVAAAIIAMKRLGANHNHIARVFRYASEALSNNSKNNCGNE